VGADEQGFEGERGRGVGVGQPVDGRPLVLAQRVQEAASGQRAQQGVAQGVGGEGYAAAGCQLIPFSGLKVASREASAVAWAAAQADSESVFSGGSQPNSPCAS
jgi:hypothetical protein